MPRILTTPISGSQCIGDSLPIINNNYEALDTAVITLSTTSITPGRLSTGGPFWNAGGSVGIGTTSPNQRLTVVGNISASGELTTTSVSSRFINLEHSVPNDGVNPVLFIGERGDGSGGTVAGSLSGFNISYNEQNNDLLVTTQFGSVTPLTAIDINSNGFVGIGGNPNSRLTVIGNISATGNVLATTVSATSGFFTNLSVSLSSNAAIGTYIGKFPIFTASGALLGHVPIYNP